MAALPAGWVYVVVVDILLGGRGGRRAPSAAGAAPAGLAHLQLLGLLRVSHRSAVGQVGVVSGVQLRSHLLLLLLFLARQGQSQDLIT